MYPVPAAPPFPSPSLTSAATSSAQGLFSLLTAMCWCCRWQIFFCSAYTQSVASWCSGSFSTRAAWTASQGLGPLPRLSCNRQSDRGRSGTRRSHVAVSTWRERRCHGLLAARAFARVAPPVDPFHRTAKAQCSAEAVSSCLVHQKVRVHEQRRQATPSLSSMQRSDGGDGPLSVASHCKLVRIMLGCAGMR